MSVYSRSRRQNARWKKFRCRLQLVQGKAVIHFFSSHQQHNSELLDETLFSLSGQVQEEKATEERPSQNGKNRSLYDGQHHDHDENGKPAG